jgi:hypothetical protein
MKTVRGGTAAAAAAAAPDGWREIRVPQAPQKAKPGCTILPQLGQMISPTGPVVTGPGVGPVGETAAAAPVGRPAATGGGVTSDEGPPLLPAPEVTRGPGVAPADSGFGGSWKDGIGAGIFGESPQGMPPRGLAAVGDAVRSSPATADAGGPGGRIVRAVSSGDGSGGAAGADVATGTGVEAAAGDAAAGAGAAAGFTSSLPQPRQNL